MLVAASSTVPVMAVGVAAVIAVFVVVPGAVALAVTAVVGMGVVLAMPGARVVPRLVPVVVAVMAAIALRVSAPRAVEVTAGSVFHHVDLLDVDPLDDRNATAPEDEFAQLGEVPGRDAAEFVFEGVFEFVARRGGPGGQAEGGQRGGEPPGAATDSPMALDGWVGGFDPGLRRHRGLLWLAPGPGWRGRRAWARSRVQTPSRRVGFSAISSPRSRCAADRGTAQAPRPSRRCWGSETTRGAFGMDQRRSPRFRTKFDALVSATTREGAGVLAEISYAGAKLTGASIQPTVGSRVKLYVFVQPVSPFELEGQVVRHIDENGFAITYELFDPEVRKLVDDVAALVG